MSNPRHYEIRLYDRPLVTFDIVDEPWGPTSVLKDYDETALNIMPCGLSFTNEGIWRWLETRSIPVNRRNAPQICKSLGFDLGDLESLYRVSLGLSLNDSYWLTPQNFQGKFADYNLFENPFSEAIGALAVSCETKQSSLSGNTPELTTDGTLRKGWRIVDGKRYLYKGSSDGFMPGEPISEYIASLIAQDLHLNAVVYGLDTWEGEYCSTCENFATKDVSYVPFAVATGATNLAAVLRWCSLQSAECFEEVCTMFAFDALICNTDRHLTNFGILRDNATGQAIGLAPLFDNGRALFPNVAEDDTKQFLLESELRGPAFGAQSFSELVQRVCGRQQHELFERFAQRGIIGNVEVPKKRVTALDGFLAQHARDLLSLPAVDHDELREKLQETVSQSVLHANNVIRVSQQ